MAYGGYLRDASRRTRRGAAQSQVADDLGRNASPRTAVRFRIPYVGSFAGEAAEIVNAFEPFRPRDGDAFEGNPF